MLVLNRRLLKARLPNITRATRRAGVRSATIFDLYSGKTSLDRAEVRTLKVLADLAGCTMDELVISEPEPEESFADSLRRWGGMPEETGAIDGPRSEFTLDEAEDIALLKRLPRSRDRGATSPAPRGKYAT